MDAIDQHLEYLAEQDEDLPEPDAALVAELQRQLRDLDLIANYSKSIRLRVELRTPLSRRD
ncbi:hypothetical protein ACFXGT_22050 [Streptomyces sp. NPDC059352]|uniref:hypothetical protein n=1 Tax=Streptomyces sp. NPDC059352 TaxID=3346810 RepID=UPI00368A8B93